MNMKNDEIDIDKADLTRRSSQPSLTIGVAERVKVEILSFLIKGQIKLLQDLPMTLVISQISSQLLNIL